MAGTADTRITLDYELKQAAKQAAARLGVSFRVYVEQALKAKLEREK